MRKKSNMRRSVVVFAVLATVFANQNFAQAARLSPLSVPAGTVLTFYLQTRLNPIAENEMDALPKGTILRVKVLDTIDSAVDRDGYEFRGEVVSPISAGSLTVLHADAQVHGLLALLRSRNHPEGFRYELLITQVNDHGKTYDLTASLSPSFVDSAPPVAGATKTVSPLAK